MGILRYGQPEHACPFDDRTLAHLALVIFDKLRCGEAFSFSFDDAEGPVSLWVSRESPLRFDFTDSARVSINQGWVLAMEESAHTDCCLSITAEPHAESVAAPGDPARQLVGAGIDT